MITQTVPPVDDHLRCDAPAQAAVDPVQSPPFAETHSLPAELPPTELGHVPGLADDWDPFGPDPREPLAQTMPQPSLHALAEAFTAGMRAATAGDTSDAGDHKDEAMQAWSELSTEFCTRFGQAFLRAYRARVDGAGRDPHPELPGA